MDRSRIEVMGAALGRFVEITAYSARVFVSADPPEVLTAIWAKWPVLSILPRNA